MTTRFYAGLQKMPIPAFHQFLKRSTRVGRQSLRDARVDILYTSVRLRVVNETLI